MYELQHFVSHEAFCVKYEMLRVVGDTRHCQNWHLSFSYVQALAWLPFLPRCAVRQGCTSGMSSCLGTCSVRPVVFLHSVGSLSAYAKYSNQMFSCHIGALFLFTRFFSVRY